MDEHKKVRVSMNQQNTHQHSKKHDLEYILTPKSNVGGSKKSNFSSNKSVSLKLLKPILFAILIGGLFGIGFMYYFSDLTPPQAVPTFNDDSSENEENNEGMTEEQENNNPNKTNVFTLSQSANQVIQYGIFSTLENAQEHVEALGSSNIPSVVHELQGQYYVLSTLLFNESDRESMRNWLEGQGLEYMVDFMIKDWSFQNVDVNVTEEEEQWLNEGASFLESSDESITEWMNHLQAWIENAPVNYQGNFYLENLNTIVSQYHNRPEDAYIPPYTNTALLNIRLFFDNLSVF